MTTSFGPIERLQYAIENAERRWSELAEDEREEPLPVVAPLAILCEQYEATAQILHDQSRHAAEHGFAQLSKIEADLAEEFDQFVNIACPAT